MNSESYLIKYFSLFFFKSFYPKNIYNHMQLCKIIKKYISHYRKKMKKHHRMNNTDKISHSFVLLFI